MADPNQFTPTTTQRETQMFKDEQDRIKQKGLAQQQQNIGAIQRRFAAMGGIGGPANEKIQSLATDNAQKQTNDELAQSQAAQDQRDQARAQVGEERAFQAGEAEKERTFTSEEAGKARGFQQQLADRDFDFQKQVFSFDKESKLKELDLSQRQFRLQKDMDTFNRGIAEGEAERASQGYLGQLLGSENYKKGQKLGGSKTVKSYTKAGTAVGAAKLLGLF